ncbi:MULTISPECIES: TIGR03751 family conjugal transfer lipoprotein [Photorhabdus]|nr:MULTISPECIES: TIGR03751 family conjugal transfer lipoprotein [Photorhabdus]MQL50324.1 TIGR03751 family conjugal transfer lipoprotein [Photorhabdus khanii]
MCGVRLKSGCLVCLLVVTTVLTGCSTSKEDMLPSGDQTMLALWQGKAASSQATMEARQVLRREVNERELPASPNYAESYSRTQENEISQTFPRLPNPDMVMYLFPHLVAGNTPVPGYSTVFPFYNQVQYALPGERTEAL